MKTVLQLIWAPKSFTCSSPSCRLTPSTVLSSVSSARGFLSPLTVIFCRLGENYKRLIEYAMARIYLDIRDEPLGILN